jgi:hypothetical protein
VIVEHPAHSGIIESACLRAGVVVRPDGDRLEAASGGRDDLVLERPIENRGRTEHE